MLLNKLHASKFCFLFTLNLLITYLGHGSLRASSGLSIVIVGSSRNFPQFEEAEGDLLLKVKQCTAVDWTEMETCHPFLFMSIV